VVIKIDNLPSGTSLDGDQELPDPVSRVVFEHCEIPFVAPFPLPWDRVYWGKMAESIQVKEERI
jgi:hypothetical protein